MKKLMTGLGAVALIGSLAACSGSDQPQKNATKNDMNTMMADPTNPFAQSEMAMDRAINAAVGVNAADSWVRKMIEHHKGAVAMSRVVLTQSPSGDVAAMAQQTIDKQSKEIGELENLIATGNPAPASSELYRASVMQMHEAMMAAKDADVSKTYLRKMLAHHQGAVAMSDVALANGASGPVRTQVEKTKADQQKEVAMVEAMLRGEPMPTMAPAAAEPAASSPASATDDPARKPPALAKPAPTTAKPKSPAPAPDPHAGMDMNNM